MSKDGDADDKSEKLGSEDIETLDQLEQHFRETEERKPAGHTVPTAPQPINDEQADALDSILGREGSEDSRIATPAAARQRTTLPNSRTLQKQYQATANKAAEELQQSRSLLTTEAPDQQQVQVCLAKLKRYNNRLQNLNDVLMILPQDEDAIDAQIDLYTDLEDTLMEQIERLHIQLNSVQPRPAASAPQPPAPSRDTKMNVRLPKLDIQKFDGNPLEFQPFWDNYTTTIDDANLSDVEKFKYLKSYLEGDAYRVADGYSLTAANYQTVKGALAERFGNRELAVFSHFTAMLELPVGSSELSSLQHTFDECDKHIRSLGALKLDESTFGQVFTPIILSKLPTAVKMSIHRAHGSQPWTLASLRQHLKDEIRARDFSQRNFGVNSTFTKAQNGGRSEQKRPNHHNSEPKNLTKSQWSPKYTSGVLLPNSGKNPYLGQCAFCDEGHRTDDCPKYPDSSSRRKLLRQQMRNHCYNCLKSDHRAQECQSHNVCRYCKRPGHHTALCYFRENPQAKPHPPNKSKMNANAKSFVPGNAVASHGTSRSPDHMYTNMQTAVAPMRSITEPQKSLTVRYLFDTAGFRSYVRKEVKEQLGLKVVDKENVSLGVFEDKKRRNKTYEVVEFDVDLPDGTKERVRANVTDTITCPIHKEPPNTKNYDALVSLRLAEALVTRPTALEIDVLIGGDYYYDFVGSEQIRFSDGMVLISSKLGYLTSGESPTTKRSPNHATLLTTHNTLPASNFDLERFWRLEDIGIKDPVETSEDEAALKTFTDSVQFIDEVGRYRVALPWKMPKLDLPDNKRLAYRRLESILKKLRSNPVVLEQYDRTIQEQSAKSIIEAAPKASSDTPKHYLAHHGVITPGKVTTKLRVVFDASAKLSSKFNSLNDCLYRGPLLLTDLCGLLLRFRCRNVAFVADIEKAFLQIEIAEEDRNFTRFLWLKDINKPLQRDNLEEFRFRVVVFGINCSPFLLAATVKHHLQTVGTNVATDIDRNIYVDNLVSGSETVDEAIAYYQEAKDIFDQASMNLREFYSNSKTLIDALRLPDQGKTKPTKVLGLTWNTEADTLSCSFSIPDKVTTKREVLQSIARIYDPLGLYSPVTVAGKMLMQKLWEAKLSWDDKLPPEFLHIWNQLQVSLHGITDLHVPRKTMTTNGTGYQLHCFCDASADAYAAVVYLREEHNASDATVELIFSKTRVSPMKKLTIPKLELMAALVGSKLLHFVTQELDFLRNVDAFLWTDNQSVLHWILGKEVTTIFVSNRVKQIRELGSEKKVEFRYVPTSQNPADIASRGMSLERLTDNKLWWHGPDWLHKKQSHWPTNARINGLLVIAEPEEISQTTLVVPQLPIDMQFVDVTRFSKLDTLIRSIGWVRRFIHNARKPPTERQRGELTAQDLATARHFLDVSSQARTYANVLSGSQDSKTRSLVQQLGLYIDPKGIIRSRGRIVNANLSTDVLQPKLLCGEDPYTQLIIESVHSHSHHVGTAHTLAELRQEYWIPKGRSVVKQVLRRCLMCRKVAARGFQVPDPPQLPQCRVDASFPFENVGLDYLGPLFIRTEASPNQKVWICIFTCAVVRAIHLEVVADMTAEQFLLCLRRFGSIYGYPKLIISDNASQFLAAKKCMKKIWRTDPEVHQFAATKGIEWKFITETAPWMGGFYERLVGLVKTSLRRTLAHTKLTLVELQTVAYELSSTLNTRPLDYVSSEGDDPMPLCPANFLLTTRTLGQTQHVDVKRERKDKTGLVAKYRKVQNVLTGFWKHWQRHYLVGLRDRSFSHDQRNRAHIEPEIGMTVIVQDDGPRGLWKMGRILDLRTSRDGKIRTVAVQMPNKHILHRPIKRLSPLEHSVDPPVYTLQSAPRHTVGPPATSLDDSEDEYDLEL